MQTAKGTLNLSTFQTILVADVTPAEALILNGMFRKAGGLVDLEYTGETATDPIDKLKSKYAKAAFSKAFPGEHPTLPKTFAEVGVKVKGVPVNPTPPQPKPASATPPTTK